MLLPFVASNAQFNDTFSSLDLRLSRTFAAGPVRIEALAAVVAEPGAQVVLLRAGGAVVGDLARRHRQEETIVAVDQLHVADDERVIERERAVSLQTIGFSLAQIDADFRELHKSPVVETDGQGNVR